MKTIKTIKLVYTLALLTCLILGCQEEEEISYYQEVGEEQMKLDFFIETFDLGFESRRKVSYEYLASGKIGKYTVEVNNPNTGNMEEERHFVFSWSDDRVEAIKGYLPTSEDPYIMYSYEYSTNGSVLKIKENNYAAGVNSKANFTYAENGEVKVSYVFSNGGYFEYEFDYTGENILRDKSTRGSQLCSEGQYTYDRYRNPFKELGYVDYYLTNISSNNRLIENHNYFACVFPQLVPESNIYEYNERGYPISVMTRYKSSFDAKSKKEFHYIED